MVPLRNLPLLWRSADRPVSISTRVSRREGVKERGNGENHGFSLFVYRGAERSEVPQENLGCSPFVYRNRTKRARRSYGSKNAFTLSIQDLARGLWRPVSVPLIDSNSWRSSL